MSTETTAAASVDTPGLSPEQLSILADAHRRARPVRRAVVVAWISGGTIGFFAVLTLLFGIFDLVTLGLGAALAVIAAVELKGARRLQSLDLGAPRMLAANQLALGAIIVVYAGWRIAIALLGPGSYDEHLVAGGPLAETLAPIDRLTRSITATVYVAVALGSIVTQGLSAWYYASRRGHILAFTGATPSWVMQTMRAAA